MPHQCTNCGRTFADGSKEMLSGCPDCTGTKFQFQPGGFDDESGSAANGSAAESAATADEPTAGATGGSAGGSVAAESPSGGRGESVSRTVGSAAATVRDLVSGSTDPEATAATPRSDGATGVPDSSTDRDGLETGGDPETADDLETADDFGTADDFETADDLDDIIVAESDPEHVSEDVAQADARSQVVGPNEVPAGSFDPTADGTTADGTTADDDDDVPETIVEDDDGAAETVVDDIDDGAAETTAVEVDENAPDDAQDDDRTVADQPDVERTDRPNLAQLRDELNEQFESIRVVEPGQYELNLMELYDREEYIIALQEDGRYSIQVPDTWRQADV